MSVHLRMAANGRVVIPAEIRKALNLQDGARLVLTVEGDAIKLEPIETVIQRVQARVRKLVPQGVSLADELIRERRDEAEGE